MGFGAYLRAMRPASRRLRRRGAGLACTLLIAALVMLVWADSAAGRVQVLREYAGYLADMASVVFGAGLIGSLLLEDILVHSP